MREFITAAEDLIEVEVDEGRTFTIDDREVRYYRPTDGQIAVYMASGGRHSTTNDKIAATIDFFLSLFSEDDQNYFVRRLWDREDRFGVQMIQKILNEMMEDWSGRPTKSPTGSTRSRKSGGQRSTAAIRA